MSTASDGNATEYVAATLRREIMSGHLPGGAPVREGDVSNRLGVSRTPVREALSRLMSEGLVVKDDNKTAHVFRPSAEDLAEIYDIRIPLESLAAKLSCRLADAAFIARVQQLGDALQATTPGPEWSVAHERFHNFIVDGCQRPRLRSIVASLRAQSEPYVRFAVLESNHFVPRAQAEHLKVVELLRKQQAAALEQLVRRHLTATKKLIAVLLDQQSQFLGPPQLPTR